MQKIFEGYYVNSETWLCLSFLLVIAIYFRFTRLLSLRNFDLLALLAISPAVYLVRENPNSVLGFTWLITVTVWWLLRAILDPHIGRRPRLEQNLAPAGMLFLSIAAFGFLTTQALTREAPATTLATVRQADRLLHGEKVPAATEGGDVQPGPAAQLLTVPLISTSLHLTGEDGSVVRRAGLSRTELLAARLVAMLSHLTILLALYWIGRWYFADPSLGVAMASLYLLLPCTAHHVGELDHVLPAAMLTMACAFSRLPILAGVFLGLACGTMVFPVFVLPLWMRYTGRSGAVALISSFSGVAIVLLGLLAWSSVDGRIPVHAVLGAIDWTLFNFNGSGVEEGLWIWVHPAYRIPVMVAFGILVVTLTCLQRKGRFDLLVAYSAAIVVATQLWYPQHGGVFVSWYLPLILLCVFRPKVLAAVPQSRPETARVATRASGEFRQPAVAMSTQFLPRP